MLFLSSLLLNALTLAAQEPRAWSSEGFAHALEPLLVGQIDLDPGETMAPQLFAPGLVSDGMDQRDSALSSDGGLFLYTLQQGRRAIILQVVKSDGVWQEPQAMPFTGAWHDLEASFRPGTRELFFASDRPLPGEEEAGDFNLWRCHWQEGAWTKPVPLPPEINGDGNEFYPSLSATGDLYFTTAREGGAGGEDIWVSGFSPGGYVAARPLPGLVNQSGDEFNAAVNPAGNRLVFGAVREEGPGGGDLYWSTRQADGSWGAASLLPGVNSPQLDFCPFFDPREEVLWFTSRRPQLATPALDWSSAREQWSAPGNGLGDLYRMPLPAAAPPPPLALPPPLH